jgi:hypothetical protein
MADASWIFGDLVGFLFGIGYVLLFVVFMDDLRRTFLWTKGPIYWTKARMTFADTGFRALELCKSTISASAQALASRAPEVDRVGGRSLVRTGKGAISYEAVVRRWGERFLPHAAVGPIQLKPTQQRAVAALTADPSSDITRSQYEKLAGVSRSQAAYDLAELVEGGILDRVGNGRATRYRLTREGGSQRRWTSDRIRAELEAFCAGRKTWPSAADFKTAGRGDLYVAASRYGGVRHWAEMLGFARPSRSASAVRQRSLLRTRLVWAGGGALAALGLATAVGAILVTVARHDATPAAQPRQEVLTQSASDESIHSAIAQARERRPRLARRVDRQRAQRSPASSSRPSNSSRAPSSLRPAQASATFAVARERSFSAVTPAPSGWPSPLRAPSGASAPAPLKAP